MFAIFLDNVLKLSIVNSDAKAIIGVPLYLSAPGNNVIKGQLRNFVLYPQGSPHTTEYLGLFILIKTNNITNDYHLREIFL